MNQTNTLKIRFFCHFDIGVLVIVSDFVLRISNFLAEKTEFSVRHYLAYGTHVSVLIEHVWHISQSPMSHRLLLGVYGNR